jgi:hypothetical protein
MNWEYMDVIRLAADPKCSSNLVNSIITIDRLLKVRRLRGPLKKLFGLGELESDQDFVSVLTVRRLCYVMMVGWSDDAGVYWGKFSIRWLRGKLGIGTPRSARRHSTISARH